LPLSGFNGKLFFSKYFSKSYIKDENKKAMKTFFYRLTISIIFLCIPFPSLVIAETDIMVYCSSNACLHCYQDNCWKVLNKTTKQFQKFPKVQAPGPKKKYKHVFNYYIPTFSFAQYALHEADRRSANLLEGFIPFAQNLNSVVFVNLRYYNPNGTPVEYNGDFGFRHLFHKNQRLLGLYTGFDRYRSDTENYFSQVHGGFEYWMKQLFWGGNIYIPVGATADNFSSLNNAYLIPTSTSYRYNIGFEEGKERALPGVDMELGYDITHGLTVYAGGYYFGHNGVKSITGPKARMTYTLYHRPHHRLLGLFDRIRLEGLLSHDAVRGTNWYAGLRASITLTKLTNSTQGLTRHMSDPLRRDLNVINSGYTEPRRLYKIDGRLARVDLVDGVNGRTIDAAVAGTDTTADIIGVIGSHTPNDVLDLGSRNLTITGGDFSFEVAGQPYVVTLLGNDGKLTFSGQTLFDINNSTSRTTAIENLTVDNTDNSYLFLENTSGNSFGHLNVEHVMSNAPMQLYLLASNSNATGNLKFSNNTISLISSTAYDHNSLMNGLALILNSTTPGQLMTVSAFSNNTISVIHTDTTPLANAVYLGSVDSSAEGEIRFSNGIQNNKIILQTAATGGTPVAGALFNTNVTTDVVGDISGNRIIKQNSSGAGDAWCQDGDLFVSGNITGNTIKSNHNTGSPLPLGLGIGWRQGGALTIMGNVSNNIFESSNNEFYGAGWYQFDSINIERNIFGDVRENQFITSDNGTAGYGWLIQQGDSLIIHGSVRRNTFTVKNNQDTGYGIHTLFLPNRDISISIGKNFSFNQFIISGNDAGDNQAYGNVAVVLGIGNLSSSTQSMVTGNVTGNVITIDDNATNPTHVNDGFLVTVPDASKEFIFEQAVTNNSITITGGSSMNNGFDLNPNSELGTIDFRGNTSETQLSKVNGNAVVNLGSGTILFSSS
jgi:hypothetical protein